MPEEPEKKLYITKMVRKVFSEEEFKESSNTQKTSATYLLSATVDDAAEETTIAFQVNGLSGAKEKYMGYYMTKDNTLKKWKRFILPEKTEAQLKIKWN